MGSSSICIVGRYPLLDHHGKYPTEPNISSWSCGNTKWWCWSPLLLGPTASLRLIGFQISEIAFHLSVMVEERSPSDEMSSQFGKYFPCRWGSWIGLGHLWKDILELVDRPEYHQSSVLCSYFGFRCRHPTLSIDLTFQVRNNWMAFHERTQ